MSKEKRSFFERLTGAPNGKAETREVPIISSREDAPKDASWMEESSEEGQLTVDVHQTPDDIIIRTIVAGVRPEDLDIAITRDMVTIRGEREGARDVADEDYFHRELYWGAFSRTVLLPQEIEVEGAEATEKHGLLTIKLPKVDKNRETKLKVKSY